MTRRSVTPRQVIEILIGQGAKIPCYRCRELFTIETAKTAEREHIRELALGGYDVIGNMAFSHKECHDLVTNGNGATTAGSSKGKISKTNRIRADRLGTGEPKRKRNWPSHKVQSRGRKKLRKEAPSDE